MLRESSLDPPDPPEEHFAEFGVRPIPGVAPGVSPGVGMSSKVRLAGVTVVLTGASFVTGLPEVLALEDVGEGSTVDEEGGGCGVAMGLVEEVVGGGGT